MMLDSIRARSCFLILLFVALCVAPAPLLASQIIIKSEDQFRFASHYMEKEEYLKAIIEFERFLYFFTDDPLVIKARFYLGLCYLLKQDHDPAREILGRVYQENSDHPIAAESLFLIGESYYRQGLFVEGEQVFRMIVEQYPQTRYKDLANYRLGWVYLREGKWQEASDTFDRVSEQGRLFTSSSGLSRDSLLGAQLDYKNPQTAGILAGVLPGLGHVYCERPRNGLVAFLLNGLTTWAAIEAFNKDQPVLGGLLAVIELGWYTGGIYSAVNCAHKHNRAQQTNLLQNMKDDLDLKMFFSRDGHAGLSLSFSF